MINNIDLYNEDLKKIVAEYKFEKLAKKTIMITGANGLIGSALIDLLNMYNIVYDYDIKIVALVRSKILDRIEKYNNVVVLKQDVIEKISYENNVNYIIHAASNSNPLMYSKDPVGTMLGNFYGMNNVLEFAKEHGSNRVVYVSSGEVYGQGNETITAFSENDYGKINPTSPRSCYPISKLASETLCASYSLQHNVETVVVRPCHIYGPTQTENDSRASAQFINNVLNNENIILKSEGKQIRSYCYVLDCVSAILKVMIDGENGNAYNISNRDSIISIKEMAELIAAADNKKVEYVIPDEIEKRGFTPVTRSVLDSTKLYNLGWKPFWKFEYGIKNTIEIMKNN